MTTARILLQTECTLFFEENPQALETVEGISQRLGRRPEDLQPILELMVSRSIVSRVGVGHKALFRYSVPDEMIIE